MLAGSWWHEEDFNFPGDFVTDSDDSATGRGNFIAEADKMNIRRLLAKHADNTVRMACV